MYDTVILLYSCPGTINVGQVPLVAQFFNNIFRYDTAPMLRYPGQAKKLTRYIPQRNPGTELWAMDIIYAIRS